MQLSKGNILAERYRIERYISSGGFANTYEAFDTRLEKRVAIKELFIEGVCNRASDGHTVMVGVPTNARIFAGQKQKFKKEALRLSSCSHHNIVSVYDVFEENDTIYYAMEFIEGKSLESFARPLSEAVVRKYLSQVIEALKHVHAKNILHLDLKPGNIMIDATDNVKIIDFGASKIVDSEGNFKSTTSQMAYTPGYAPLEQINGGANVGPYSDIYALGATLYNLLTGKKPPLVDELLADNSALRVSGISQQMQSVITQSMVVSSKIRLQNVSQIEDILNSNVSSGDNTVFDASRTMPKIVTVPKPTQGNTSMSQRNTFGGKNMNGKYPQHEEGKGNKVMMISIIALLSIIAVLGAVFLFKYLNGNDSNGDAATPLQPTQAGTVKPDSAAVTNAPSEQKTEAQIEKPAETVAAPAPPPEKKTLTYKYYGTVGPYHVNVTLNFPDGEANGGNVTGTYSYKEFKTDKLLLNGSIVGKQIRLIETTKKTKNYSADWELNFSSLNRLDGHMVTIHTGEYNSVSLKRVN
ncbi:MAG: serine/threonine protein kinase [Muribaculaceae bacterium]|nr:serine/threonine protein kinase [Muribaculaceae bacterium]